MRTGPQTSPHRHSRAPAREDDVQASSHAGRESLYTPAKMVSCVVLGSWSCCEKQLARHSARGVDRPVLKTRVLDALLTHASHTTMLCDGTKAAKILEEQRTCACPSSSTHHFTEKDVLPSRTPPTHRHNKVTHREAGFL